MTESLALSDHALFLKRVYPVTPRRLWRAWTDPEHLVQWFYPNAKMQTVEAQADVRVGGRYRMLVHGESGVREVGGEYLEVDPPHRLVFTWKFPVSRLQPEESVVTVEFMPVDGGTELRLTHERLSGTDSREAHIEGWTACFEALDRYLESLEDQL